jgi:hypothetical protein
MRRLVVAVAIALTASLSGAGCASVLILSTPTITEAHLKWLASQNDATTTPRNMRPRAGNSISAFTDKLRRLNGQG